MKHQEIITEIEAALVFDEGVDAAETNQPLDSNPYKYPSQRAAWDLGYIWYFETTK